MIRKVKYSDLIQDPRYADIFNEMIDLMDAAAEAFDSTITTGTRLTVWAKQYKEKRK